MSIKSKQFGISKKRAQYFEAKDILKDKKYQTSKSEIEFFEKTDVIYRTLCAVLFNYAPTSGHPGGSISSGRIVEGLLFNNMDYELAKPNRLDNDLISYAAGHKAMGLYAMWGLRNEMIKVGNKTLLAKNIEDQLRLEDLLGFRKNPVTKSKLFKKFKSKALDGHPAPNTPFVKLSTGASGVGMGSSLGLAFAGSDYFGEKAPRVNIIEGEGGLTPGRVAEVLASAATTGIDNAVVHIDWNQASIDSNQVTSDGKTPGDYVQWMPQELFYTNDWNVIYVEDGHCFEQIFAAQKFAKELKSKQPTAIIYRTVKGWKYGIEGRSSHGAGHKFASDDFYSALSEFEKTFGVQMPRFCGSNTEDGVEECFWNTLLKIREALECNKALCKTAVNKMSGSLKRLNTLKRKPRAGAGNVDIIYNKFDAKKTPKELAVTPGTKVTLRGVMGDTLGYLNKQSKGALLASSADLSGSTNTSNIVKHFPQGFYNKYTNPKARLLSIGGICEDGMSAIMTGVSGFGKHIGLCSSYAAFIAALEHVAARLHAIGQQTKNHVDKKPYNTFIMLNAHAGLKTGEDGPTHADPQALQLLQENFPKGTSITVTALDGAEIWPIMITALKKRPAILAPFVSRPNESVIDRKALKMGPATDAAKGVQVISKHAKADGTIVLQGNGVGGVFIEEVMPVLKKEGIKLNVFYVSSKELFDMLPAKEQETIMPGKLRQEAMGITDFTKATMYYFINSLKGLNHTLHPYKKGHYLGSGQAVKVFKEAGLDASGQLKAVRAYLKERKQKKASWC
ncbi:MAG: hypothetical protein HN833_01245 [Elusimicrobiaceae bacterium]|jgi:transketolase|nr:hypothetical protein [Elusimicrobiaceae bacterium]MBT3955641.1 hypothetical protein [Elusimicrobiaceae bacterium]MBT4008512.1 hypothetical protein [Elusimicrobiaceae bacterium]MBT4403400.1 hypothetical protein [Elusimicrobiaceae bacterium]MBT4439711.1 hypothetical protein [Elusimicrobiaceae bacterium]